ncbi:hypothetical protein CCMA1212_009680 [Trichoderma ghanense]|uniref:Uncharacterized protein n=1 Tax=Trichoderma ghanense TaxID=65468 RepID=A0ABY2GRC2_9HYPO
MPDRKSKLRRKIDWSGALGTSIEPPSSLYLLDSMAYKSMEEGHSMAAKALEDVEEQLAERHTSC